MDCRRCRDGGRVNFRGVRGSGRRRSAPGPFLTAGPADMQHDDRDDDEQDPHGRDSPRVHRGVPQPTACTVISDGIGPWPLPPPGTG
jgi:hypothetical protein